MPGLTEEDASERPDIARLTKTFPDLDSDRAQPGPPVAGYGRRRETTPGFAEPLVGLCHGDLVKICVAQHTAIGR